MDIFEEGLPGTTLYMSSGDELVIQDCTDQIHGRKIAFLLLAICFDSKQ